jgi:hypothetical protein
MYWKWYKILFELSICQGISTFVYVPGT